MELSVLNINGQETGRKVTLNESIFGIEPNDHVIYLDVKQYLANQRQGTAKAKERSEVSGSTRKLIRQRSLVHCPRTGAAATTALREPAAGISVWRGCR